MNRLLVAGAVLVLLCVSSITFAQAPCGDVGVRALATLDRASRELDAARAAVLVDESVDCGQLRRRLEAVRDITETECGATMSAEVNALLTRYEAEAQKVCGELP